MHDLKAKVVLVDIEGTTTSISFVKDILFPYAKDHCYEYLKKTWSEDTTKVIVDDLKTLTEYNAFKSSDVDHSSKPDLEQITDFVHYLIQKDLKLKPLKTLQGLIWEYGYKDGTLVGHVYDDVPEAFKIWTDNGVRIAVYSSGSIWAQKLLFGQTKYGCLSTYLNGYFDSTSGMKTESQSYRNISSDLGVKAAEVLFLTDIVKEADAAMEAGMQTVLLCRPGNAPLTIDEKISYKVVNNFTELHVHYNK